MIEMTIYGRGGQGGVTLAKLIANAYFLEGKHVQAFGVYAAERSGAPLQAYVRIDDSEITNHNQIREPDHVIVLDRTLTTERVLIGHKPDGWIILNSPDAPEAFTEMFPGRNVATLDATCIAVANGLGTRTVPIVNTTILGAAGRVLGLTLDDVKGALAEVNFGGGNVTAATQAFESVRSDRLAGEPVAPSMPQRDTKVAGLFDDVVGSRPKIHTGDWTTRQPHRQQLTPPCNNGCPAGNDVRGFLEAVGKKDHTEALRILHETSPFPAVCGRVCPAPCMDACNRSEFDESVNIRELERFAADKGKAHVAISGHDDPHRWRDEMVAVVGSGPAGLSAAYHLARLAYRVTLFERDDELGGVMRTGIPSYRLPREVLDREIKFIVDHGVTVETGWTVDREELLRLSHAFSAVFVGTGLQHLRAMDLGSADGGDGKIEQGIAFLDRIRRAPESLEGERVIVIGGGNTAMDAARSARRLGARVEVVYRRSRDQMPAIREEIDEAIEEGIELRELVSPVRLRHDGVGHLLTCVRMRLGEPDESGRPRPVQETSEDAYFDMRCDRVVLALGQSSDLSILPEGSEVKGEESPLGLTGAPVFAGGDFAVNEGTVTAAIGGGRRAAWHIHRTLTGEDLFPPPAETVAEPDVLRTHVFSHSPRSEPRMLELQERRRSFTEVRSGFSPVDDGAQAVAEAQRCFSCGVCTFCDRCMDHCPEGILLRNGEGYTVNFDHCKGCGICASECPRGVIYMADL